MLSKLILVNPEQRISIKSLKKHSFFKGIDWKQVTEGKLKMPAPLMRPVTKSPLPMSIDCDSDEEENQYSSSI